MKRTLAVFVIGVLFVGAMLRATGGRPSLPLDDSFIYFQYARQAAAGHPFVYQPGDAPTTGCTSIPWMGVLAVGSLLGFGGKAIVFFAMIAGGALLSFAAKWTGDAARRLDPASPGVTVGAGGVGLAGGLAIALVVLSGPLHWAAWSGMEIALFAAMLAWAFREWAQADGRPGRRPALALAAVALVRPEGGVLAGVALVAWVVQAVWRRDRTALAWAVLPAAAIAVQPIVNLLLTGDVRSSGYVAKALLAAPGATFLDALRIAALRAVSLGSALFAGGAPFADGRGLYAYESETAWWFVAPGAGALFLVGALPAAVGEWRRRALGAAALALLWTSALVFVTCLLEEPDAHFHRYQMPVLPIVLAFVAVGVARIADALGNARGGLALLSPGLRVYLVAFGAASVVFFALAYGDNCEDIDRMQIALGEELNRTLEPDDVVAINDAGSLAYFSKRHTIDLIGLTTPGFAGLWPHGSAALWEKLESMPAADRPEWFCIFPNWFDFDGVGLLRRKGGVRLLTPSIVDAEKVLYLADWTFAGSGDRLALAGVDAETPAPRVIDRIDVADLASERVHAFVAIDGERGGTGGTFLHRAPVGAGAEIVDGGRTIFREARFTIARDTFGDAQLVARTVSGARQRLSVSIDGAAPVDVELYAPGGGRFHEQVMAAVPAGPGPAAVVVRVSPEPASSAPLLLAHVFCVAGGP